MQWSRYQGLKLTFEPTESDEKFCLAVGDSKLYFNSYGHDELWKLGSYEFLHQIMEFIQIL
jgi:hypothetical protein